MLSLLSYTETKVSFQEMNVMQRSFPTHIHQEGVWSIQLQPGPLVSLTASVGYCAGDMTGSCPLHNAGLTAQIQLMKDNSKMVRFTLSCLNVCTPVSKPVILLNILLSRSINSSRISELTLNQKGCHSAPLTYLFFTKRK